ncbi:MAG TPA: hypothetical protein VNQ81_04015 [Povalibacter sp.]|nr:hypothetical protein [Povalibacter sp.]
MRQPAEISIELTAQELLAPPTARHLSGIQDVDAAALLTAPVAANAATSLAVSAGDCIEIELTPQEMDALLSGNLQL